MNKYIVEFIGTFIFLSVILREGSAIPIAIALASVIYFGGAVSGGHFNPAVSVMAYLNESLSLTDLPFYIIVQLAGGAAALMFYKNYTLTNNK
jgi:aquaporin Z